jgi:hypothetical protein
MFDTHRRENLKSYLMDFDFVCMSRNITVCDPISEEEPVNGIQVCKYFTVV